MNILDYWLNEVSRSMSRWNFLKVLDSRMPGHWYANLLETVIRLDIKSVHITKSHLLLEKMWTCKVTILEVGRSATISVRTKEHNSDLNFQHMPVFVYISHCNKVHWWFSTNNNCCAEAKIQSKRIRDMTSVMRVGYN